jgi:hypothetical protein
MRTVVYNNNDDNVYDGQYREYIEHDTVVGREEITYVLGASVYKLKLNVAKYCYDETPFYYSYFCENYKKLSKPVVTCPADSTIEKIVDGTAMYVAVYRITHPYQDLTMKY